MEPIIEVKNIGKRYKITHERGGYIALRDVVMNIVKSPFSYLKYKAKSVAGLEKKEDFWALKDVNFTVKKGEVIGIIGRNGAGKSTLLKILSQITPPTEGEIILRGRVGSLLEVGTGFHPELTGRENIFLNGAILGMQRKEIAAKFDKIVEFAGIEKFLDTPVKYYSSGMYVRLAFSVAAHMEPDILIIDEVLAVGDAEFQKKCLGKMEEVANQDGRTIIFVSHNMGAIKSLCSKTIWFEKSTIKSFGETEKVVDEYMRGNELAFKSNTILKPDFKKEITFTNISIRNDSGKISNSISVNESFTIDLQFSVQKDIDGAEISIFLKNLNGVGVIFTSLSDSFDQIIVPLKKGTYSTKVTIKKNFLMPDEYFIGIGAHIRGIRNIDNYDNILNLNIVENNSNMMKYGKYAKQLAVVLCDAKWEILQKPDNTNQNDIKK
jgi:lipopolysaccharide transport system ATP-binding protein